MFFRKKQAQAEPDSVSKLAPQAPRPEWDLRLMTQRLKELAPVLETKEIEPLLIQARLADHYRDLNREPVPPPQFDRIVHHLDTESWRRLALAVGTLDHPDIRSTLARLTTTVVQQVEAGFVAMATNTNVLTLSLLRQSDVRIEEFARHLAGHLGVFWHGESAEQSSQRLQQLDYRRLLAAAEEAKKQAEQRMEYLRKKQEEEAARRRPRGKL
jgi:hypothetical protein